MGFKLLSLYLFLAILALSYLFVHSFVRGRSQHAKLLGILSLTLQVYLLGYLVELNATSLDAMIFWNQIQYFGIPFFPALWFAVSTVYTGRPQWIQGWRGLLVISVPVLTFVIRLTNDFHHWYYTSMTLVFLGDYTAMYLVKGPWYLVQMVYVLITLVACTRFYALRYRKAEGNEKMQFSLLLWASILPFVALVLVFFNFGDLGIDYTAMILPPCILLINHALMKYNFLEIKEMARERVFEDNRIGYLLLSKQLKVVDMNPLGKQLLKQLEANNPSIHEWILDDAKHLIQLEKHNKTVSISSQAIENSGYLVSIEDVSEREAILNRLEHLANIDALTQLNNRRSFFEQANQIFEHADRYHEPLACLMIDIDHFKDVNDHHGHEAGDTVLKSLAVTMKQCFRSSDVIARMGGEEFAVLLRMSEMDAAHLIAERLRVTVEKESIQHSELNLNITISLGLAVRNVHEDLESVLRRADKALYEAKAAGRNQVRRAQ